MTQTQQCTALLELEFRPENDGELLVVSHSANDLADLVLAREEVMSCDGGVGGLLVMFTNLSLPVRKLIASC